MASERPIPPPGRSLEVQGDTRMPPGRVHIIGMSVFGHTNDETFYHQGKRRVELDRPRHTGQHNLPLEPQVKKEDPLNLSI